MFQLCSFVVGTYEVVPARRGHGRNMMKNFKVHWLSGNLGRMVTSSSHRHVPTSLEHDGNMKSFQVPRGPTWYGRLPAPRLVHENFKVHWLSGNLGPVVTCISHGHVPTSLEHDGNMKSFQVPRGHTWYGRLPAPRLVHENFKVYSPKLTWAVSQCSGWLGNESAKNFKVPS